MKKPVAVLISGNGTNLQALIDATIHPAYPAHIVCVISNKADAYGLQRARAAGIPAHVLSHKAYADRESYDRALHAVLTDSGAKLVCLAGFMRLLSPWFVGIWAGKLLNIHPSLLPAFKGGHAIADALAARVQETGVTVHIVTEEMDAGPILAQMPVPVLPDDTQDTLAERIHSAEHALYPAALKQFCEKSM